MTSLFWMTIVCKKKTWCTSVEVLQLRQKQVQCHDEYRRHWQDRVKVF